MNRIAGALMWIAAAICWHGASAGNVLLVVAGIIFAVLGLAVFYQKDEAIRFRQEPEPLPGGLPPATRDREKPE